MKIIEILNNLSLESNIIIFLYLVLSIVNYVNTIYPTISSISTYKISGQKYYITDKNNNLFIIVTNGVMNYKVYLDDYTVDITNYDK